MKRIVILLVGFSLLASVADAGIFSKWKARRNCSSGSCNTSYSKSCKSCGERLTKRADRLITRAVRLTDRAAYYCRNGKCSQHIHHGPKSYPKGQSPPNTPVVPSDVPVAAPETGANFTPAQSAMLTNINVRRHRAGVESLVLDEQLSAACESHCKKMAADRLVTYNDRFASQAISRLPSSINGRKTTTADITKSMHEVEEFKAHLLDARNTRVGISFTAAEGSYYTSLRFMR